MARFRTAAVIFGALAVAAPAAAARLGAVCEMLRAPAVAGDRHSVEGLELAAGNAKLSFDGTVETVVAGGVRLGFAFSGSGTIAVTVQEGPFHRANLSTLDAEVGFDREGPYVRRFEQALILAGPVPEGAVPAAVSGETGLGDVLARSLDWWSGTRYPQLDHVLAPVVLDDLGGTHVLAFLWGGDGPDLVYAYDDTYDREEQLLRWDKSSYGGRSVRYLVPLLTQPAGFDLRARPQSVVRQVDVDLDLVSPDNELLRERTTTEIEAGRSGVQVVTFSLLNGRSERPEPWDERDDPFVVGSVRTVDGTELEHSHRYDQLMVKLPEPLRLGQRVRLVIEAEGRLLKNYSGDSYLVLGNMAYFPSLDIYDVHGPFRSKVVVAEPYVPLATGETVRRWSEEGLHGVESLEEEPISFPFVIVGKFEVHEESRDDYTIRVYSYAMGKKRGAEALARNGLAILDFYSNGMHDFPYGELEVVEIPYFRHFFWQAPAGVVEITSEGLNPIAGDASDLDTLLRRYASKGQNARYAHEIAHQWFGNIVSWATPYDNWLSESFAEYLSYLFLTEGGKEKRKAKAQFQEWEIDTRECSDRSSIYGAASLGGSPQNRRCYTQLLYGKGPYVLHALRQEMGDEQFKKMLYFLTAQASKKQIKVTTEDVIQLASVLAGRDMRPFFDRYVYGTEVPELGG